MNLVWQYIGKVLSFTLRGSVKQADSWQILIGGTALPSIIIGVFFQIVGLNVPTFDAAQFPTYLGYGFLVWLCIRLLIAPFFIWREQFEESVELRLELSKPERIVLERLAKHRAKALSKLCGRIHKISLLTFIEDGSKRSVKIQKQGIKAMNLAGVSGLPREFNQVIIRYSEVCESFKDSEQLTADQWSDFHENIIDCINGKMTLESLLLQLPPSIEEETQP